MVKGIISDMLNLNFEFVCSSKESGYEKNKAHHFITKVMVSSLRVNGASYADCHYNGNLPTRKGMGFSSLETRSLYHFVYKLILMIL